MINPQKLYKTIGENIRKARKEQGLSQNELAERLAYSNTTISKIENGTRKSGLDELASFATVLGKPIDYFFGAIYPPGRNEDSILPLGNNERQLVPVWDNLGAANERKTVSYCYFDPSYLEGRAIVGLRFFGNSLDESIKKGDAVFYDTLATPGEGDLVLVVKDRRPTIMRCVKQYGDLALQYPGGHLSMRMVKIEGVIIESHRKYR
jgi:transcriptional regulator with XRE-family HTH domain